MRKHINTQSLVKAQSPEMRGALAALRRAAASARKTAIQTDTNLVVVKDDHRPLLMSLLR